MKASKDDGRFYDGVIAALGALRGMESPASVHYHEVARTFDLDELCDRARRTGNMRWAGLDKYMRYQKKEEAWRASCAVHHQGGGSST